MKFSVLTNPLRTRAAKLLCGLCVFAMTPYLAAELFDYVEVETVPELIPMTAVKGHQIISFRIANRNSLPAKVAMNITNVDGTKSVSRQMLIPAKAVIYADLHWPIGVEAYRRGMLSPTLNLRIDGKAYKMNLPVGSSYPNHKVYFLASELDMRGDLRFFFKGRDYMYVQSLLAVGQWPEDLRSYAAYEVIMLNSENPPSPGVMRVLDDFVMLGGTLVFVVPPDAVWPGKVPGGEKNINIQYRGFGRIVHCRPLHGGNSKKIHATLTDKTNPSYAAKHNRRSLDSLALDEAAGEFNRICSSVAMLYGDFTGKGDVNIVLPPLPMLSIALIMGVFVIIIGPVNYFWLKKRRKTAWLLVTVPLLSAIFCMTMIALITFGEGWYSRGKICALSYLDQTAGRAYSRCAVGMYAPIMPRGVFSFEVDDVVSFFNPGTIEADLSGRQIYAPEVLQPRLPLYYLVTAATLRHDRLVVRSGGEPDSIEVVNGLGAEIVELAVSAPSGWIFVADKPLAAGEKRVLRSRKMRTRPRSKALSFKEAVSGKWDSSMLSPGEYRAVLKEIIMIKPGMAIDRPEKKHIVFGKYN